MSRVESDFSPSIPKIKVFKINTRIIVPVSQNISFLFNLLIQITILVYYAQRPRLSRPKLAKRALRSRNAIAFPEPSFKD